MEGYLFAGKLIQDSHMRQTQKLPRYVKKYDIQNSSIRLTNLCYHNYSLSHTPTQKQKDKDRDKEKQKQKQKVQGKKEPKFSQENPNYKINGLINGDIKSVKKVSPINTDVSQFFVKKQIHPKSTRESSQRSNVLFKSYNPPTGNFYDFKMNVIKRKSRNCIILPERKEKNEKSETIQSNQNDKQIMKKARQWVQQEWQQQRRKRNAQCKTACQFYRQKGQAILSQQAKKMEEEIKNKQFEQKVFKTHNKSKRYQVSKEKENWKKTQPLSKDEMKQLCTVIMKKYKVDSSVYSESIRKIL